MEAKINYYEHHLGDYAKDTVHLSMIEHGAYRLLLDRYYGTEAGIPADQVHRFARARTKEEKDAVDVVLAEFFRLVDGVWINHRAEIEIEKAKVRIDAAKNNGKRGGRPRKKPEGSENETQQKPGGFSVGSENETQQKTHQTPYTRHHTPVETHTVGNSVDVSGGGGESSADTAPTPCGLACKAIREAGIAEVNPGHPMLKALLQAGATVDELRSTAVECVGKGKANFAYVLGTARRRREEAAGLVLHQGQMPASTGKQAIRDSYAAQAAAARGEDNDERQEHDITGESERVG